jgi:hypothetical protein
MILLKVVFLVVVISIVCSAEVETRAIYRGMKFGIPSYSFSLFLI